MLVVYFAFLFLWQFWVQVYMALHYLLKKKLIIKKKQNMINGWMTEHVKP